MSLSVHPGDIIIEDFMIPKQMTIAELAEKCDISIPATNNLLNGHASITEKLAERLAKTFGNTKEFWLDLQEKYDKEK